MIASQAGIKFIKDREGFRAKAYKDTGGVWTIGYGTTVIDGRPVGPSDTCTDAQASQWIVGHLQKVYDCINKNVKPILSQGQFDALCSFIYNLGEQAFIGSTLLKKLNQGDFVGAADQFPRWVYDNGKVQPGLVTRRAAERDMFKGD